MSFCESAAVENSRANFSDDRPMKQKTIFDDSIGLGRIGSMSDGVFSIVITLLVFEIKLPPGTPPGQLSQALHKLSPQLVSYFITFFLIGIYWVGHHALMRHIRRYDRHFLWLNILFLMCLAFLPFPTALLGSYSAEQLSIVIYGLTLIATGCALWSMWRYATRDHLLVESELSPRIIAAANLRILTAPMIAALSIMVSFISIHASIALYAISGLLYLLPASLDRIIAAESGGAGEG